MRRPLWTFWRWWLWVYRSAVGGWFVVLMGTEWHVEKLDDRAQQMRRAQKWAEIHGQAR